MTDINAPQDCGNSPKSRTLKELVVAIALADCEMISRIVSDDVQWRPVAGKPVSGMQAVCRGLVRRGPAAVLTINHIIVHGRSGAVDGVSEYRRKKRAFYLVVDFTSAKGERVREIRSFSTDISSG